MSYRLSKSVATQRMARAVTVAQYHSGGDDSDDSLVGDHSPFVRHVGSRKK